MNSNRVRDATTLTALAATVAIGQQPPAELRLWAFGTVATAKGDFTFELPDAELVMLAYQEQGNDLWFDYEHGILTTPPGQPVPAAGWFNLELRDDGLWMTNIRWTERAAGMIQAGEIGYLSPLFAAPEPERRITALVNCALTNNPATKRLAPLAVAASLDLALDRAQFGSRPDDLVAASLSSTDLWAAVQDAVSDGFGMWAYVLDVFTDYAVFQAPDGDGETCVYRVSYTLDESDQVQLGEVAEEARRQYPVVPEGRTMNRSILVALSLAPTATEADALTRIKAITHAQDQLIALTGTSSLDEAIAAANAWKTAAEQNVSLAQRLADLEQGAEKRERDDLIALGQQQKKIPPALLEWAQSQSPAALRAYLDKAPVALGGAPEQEGKPGELVALSKTQAQVAEQLGLSTDVFTKADR